MIASSGTMKTSRPMWTCVVRIMGRLYPQNRASISRARGSKKQRISSESIPTRKNGTSTRG